MQLNDRAWTLAERRLEAAADECGVGVQRVGGATVIDCGVRAAGGFAAGVALAEVCMAGLGRICLVPGGEAGLSMVQVTTDHPVAACLRSQYAGWAIRAGESFAMGSGPMRAVYGGEALYDAIGGRESAERVVGVLEMSAIPNVEMVQWIAEKLARPPERIKLLVARTKSMAGAIQVVARSVETALHQLHELKFDVMKISHGYGVAPLPPPSADDLTALGRTNDAILYGGRVALWARAGDDELAEVVARVPSVASADHGRPFAELFAAAGHDFYRIDPRLFAPAVVTLTSLQTGRTFTAGRVAEAVLRRSFGV